MHLIKQQKIPGIQKQEKCLACLQVQYRNNRCDMSISKLLKTVFVWVHCKSNRYNSSISNALSLDNNYLWISKRKNLRISKRAEPAQFNVDILEASIFQKYSTLEVSGSRPLAGGPLGLLTASLALFWCSGRVTHANTNTNTIH